jgi:hypothetical protein
MNAAGTTARIESNNFLFNLGLSSLHWCVYCGALGASKQFQGSSGTAKTLRGGIFFHPSDEDQSPGTPEREKPLQFIGSDYSNPETVLAL